MQSPTLIFIRWRLFELLLTNYDSIKRVKWLGHPSTVDGHRLRRVCVPFTRTRSKQRNYFRHATHVCTTGLITWLADPCKRKIKKYLPVGCDDYCPVDSIYVFKGCFVGWLIINCVWSERISILCKWFIINALMLSILTVSGTPSKNFTLQIYFQFVIVM